MWDRDLNNIWELSAQTLIRELSYLTKFLTIEGCLTMTKSAYG